MRLTAIKLAGFKSFVDATTFTAPTNLTGIVGPNGCGKSNLLEALRWVMGETRPKAMRGGGMEDVEAVGNLRAATAVFRVEKGSWATDGRALFGGRTE